MDLPPSRRVILHTDVNSAYASMERVFNPKLRGRPVCILSNNDGCIVALTKDAKALGIKRGTPYFKVRDLCEKHDVAVLSSNYELYDAMSSRFHKIVAGFGPVHEAYSIDEAFLDLTGVECESYTTIGRDLKERILKWIGLPVCVGIAPTKTLAKLCDHFAKTYPVYGGVVNWFDLSPERRKKALSITPIGEVWGIGRKTEEKLLREGIENVWQFSQADVFTLRRRYGVVLERTLREIQGVSCLPVESVPKPKEQILRSRSFSHATNDDLAAVERAMEETHTAEFAGRQVRELSGGQLQRVWLALALAQTHEALLLDEITTYLDVHYQYEILDLIRSFNKNHGTTVLMVLHDINQTIRYADNVVMMKEGKVLAAGTADEVITEEMLRRTYDVDAKLVAVEDKKICIFD